MQKEITFRRILHRKRYLSAGYCAERYNFPQDPTQKEINLRRILRRKRTLYAVFSAEKDNFPQDTTQKEIDNFPQDTMQKEITFHRILRRKRTLSAVPILRVERDKDNSLPSTTQMEITFQFPRMNHGMFGKINISPLKTFRRIIHKT